MEGVVAIIAWHVELGALSLELRHQPAGAHLQLELVDRRFSLDQNGGDQRHRQHRHQAGDLAHHVMGQPADDLEALVLVEAAQVAARFPGVGRQPVARRHQRPEIDAGIAEAEPAAAQYQAELAEPEAERGMGGEPGAAPRRLLVE